MSKFVQKHATHFLEVNSCEVPLMSSKTGDVQGRKAPFFKAQGFVIGLFLTVNLYRGADMRIVSQLD